MKSSYKTRKRYLTVANKKLTPEQIFAKLKEDDIERLKTEVSKIVWNKPDITFSGLVAEVTLRLRMDKVNLSTKDILDYCHTVILV